MKDRSAIFIASAAITVFLTGTIIIAHDISEELRQFLASLTGHHWTAVSVITAIVFLLISIIIYLITGSEEVRRTLKADSLWNWSWVLTAITLVMALGVMAVYVLHYISA